MLLARMISLLGPIDLEMLLRGQETHKYFTKEYDLFHINEVCALYLLTNLIKILQDFEDICYALNQGLRACSANLVGVLVIGSCPC